MTRIQSLFAAVTVAAIAAAVPAANAQAVHFVAAGSSAQWQMAAIAADQLAINENTAAYGGAETVQHWTGSNNAEVTDSRDGSIIQPEVGNPWLVWLQNGGTVTDVWFAISVDSTVGVRTFSAQEDISGTQVSGGQIVITATAGTAGANKINANLWPDNTGDVALTTASLNAIQNQHVNVGMTDIRPEDALFATKRALATLNTTTWAGLGYKGPNANVGAPIFTAQGTGTEATPIEFGLQGKVDPFNSVQKVDYTVPAYTTIPIGAAPIVFVMNHGSATAFPSDLATGVTPDKHVTGQTYPLANLFDGTSACTTTNPAFDASIGGPVTPTALNVILREPLSGTMNTTEFNLFRSFGNTDDSQEKGVINAFNSPYNPLKLTCQGGGGQRQRAIGTGEVVNAVNGEADSIGYIFWGFGNAAKLSGTTRNYLTLDGVDPLGLPASLTGNGAQELPNCTAPTCPASLWTGSNSFPSLRNGTYKAWSIYRWLIANSNIGTDPYGFDAVAQAAQDYVDQDVADFVPFITSTGSDGLSVYRSHFTQEGITCTGTDTCNGNATAANSLNGGNALGGGPEQGGDVGGLVQGPFGITVPTTNGTGEVHTALVRNKGYELLWKSGVHFTAGTSWEGSTITINGSPYTVANVALTTTILYTTTPVGATNDATYSFSAPFAYTYPLATAPGVLGKKQ